MKIQDKQQLDVFYQSPDPWKYEGDPSDQRRQDEIRSALSGISDYRLLDIGCGDGFVTFSLPASSVVGIDLSSIAIDYARTKARQKSSSAEYIFMQGSLFHLDTILGPELKFDVVLITGVLYPQYIGRGFAAFKVVVDKYLEYGGYLLSVHIDEWNAPIFDYTLVDCLLYPYREFTHRLELYKK
jgi:SAM-dependent methyltransferase